MGKSTVENVAAGANRAMSAGVGEFTLRDGGKKRKINGWLVAGALGIGGGATGLAVHLHNTDNSNAGEAIAATIDGAAQGEGIAYQLGSTGVGLAVSGLDWGLDHIGLEEVGNFFDSLYHADFLDAFQDGRNNVRNTDITVDWGN